MQLYATAADTRGVARVYAPGHYSLSGRRTIDVEHALISQHLSEIRLNDTPLPIRTTSHP